MTAPARDALGRPLNPDTNLPYPSASAAQEQLADELYARLIDGLDARELSREELRDALVEVAVRQHGRTLRACLDEQRAEADRLDAHARELAEEAVGDVVDADKLAQAARLVGSAWSLRAMHLRADRA